MKTKLSKTYNYLLQLGIIIIVYGFLYNELFQKHNLSELSSQLDQGLGSSSNIYLFVTAFLLMFLNLAIESAKWKFIISKIEIMPFGRAFQAIFTGLSFGIFTPNRLGSFMGRIFFLKKANRVEGTILTFLGNTSQLIVTLFSGNIALMFFIPFNFDLASSLIYGIVISLILVNVLLLLLFFNIPYITGILNKVSGKYKEKINAYFVSIRKFSTRELGRILLLSMFRYLVFSFQFYLLLNLFEVFMPLLHTLMITSVIYIIITIIPSIALSELGLRGSVSVFLFQQYFDRMGISTNGIEVAVFASSVLLWIINIILPSVIGTFFVYRLKFFRNSYE